MSPEPAAGGPLRRPSWSAFRAELAACGFRPSKTLGQNFLVDSNAVRAIAEDARLPARARVLEVGAGCGFLTLELALAGHALLAVEIDARLLAVAQHLLAGHANVRWLHADALAGKHALEPRLLAALEPAAPWHVVSNLPYSISAPLLAVLARLPNPPVSLTVLVQDEVARRIAAAPGEREWGALGARLALTYRAELGRAVGAQLFWPKPRVASRVVHLVARPPEERGGDVAAAELAAYDRMVEVLFGQRRKQIAAVLGGGLQGGREATLLLLGALGLDPTARAETLGPEALLGLARSPLGRALGPLRMPRQGP